MLVSTVAVRGKRRFVGIGSRRSVLVEVAGRERRKVVGVGSRLPELDGVTSREGRRGGRTVTHEVATLVDDGVAARSWLNRPSRSGLS